MTRWLAAFLEAGGDAYVVTRPTHAENAKIATIVQYEPTAPHFSNNGDFGSAYEDQNISTNADDWQESFDERAAIIEHEAGIPRDSAEAFARVCLKRPASITKQGWQRIVDNTGRLLDDKNNLHEMVRHGWSIADIFGCHPGAPEVRQDVKGLLLLLDESEVISIVNEKVIGLRRTHSGSMLFYRKPLNPSPERVMIWELGVEQCAGIRGGTA